jgi:hypothetical protein
MGGKADSSGLKPLVMTKENVKLITARLKPCPDTKRSYTSKI